MWAQDADRIVWRAEDARWHRPGTGGTCQRAFSLAEMMIALAVLAMGLLVIGAALPIGVRYTRESVNLATGEAAAEYALDVVEQNLCVMRTIFDAAGTTQIRQPGIFVPRDDGAGVLGQFLPTFEPVIKVRPLLVRSIMTKPGAQLNEWWGDYTTERILETAGQTLGIACGRNELDCDADDPTTGRWVWPPIASIAQAYPPVTGKKPQDPNEFRPLVYPQVYVQPGEMQQAVQQRTVWCAFYRRVSYAADSDPFRYELITVVSRLPSERHRFPVQDPGSLTYYANGPISDTAAPIPWLISFSDLPCRHVNVDYQEIPVGDIDERVLLPGFAAAQPATLEFTANDNQNWGALLVPGSVLIPAVNDFSPTFDPTQRQGFVPSAPDTLPIYEVQEQIQAGSEFRIRVKNNGFYPWVQTAGPPQRWLVWVVPPPFEELDSSGQPVYPNRNPIVSVARRVVRLRELP